MIAPEPFFEPRGTPFSEFHRIRALVALGHEVDLVTYPFGQSVAMPGLRIYRCLKPPFLRGIGVGPSAAKIPLDALLALGVAGLTTADDCLATHGGLHLVDPEGQHLGDVPEDVAPIPPLAGLGIGRPVLAASAGRDLTQPGPRLTCPVA